MEVCEVETASGRIRGLLISGVRQFKGVPYGASTAGANRWQQPRPPQPWTGVRDCFGPGPVSPQVPYARTDDYARVIQFDLNTMFGGVGEDCLHVNVWAPPDRAAKHPVLVCVHGGGFALCSGNHPLYDGAALAALGNVVVVSVTHRLASFGFLDLAALDPGGPWTDAGVVGMLDLLAALRWVRDNVAAFGGDPGSVMVFGQSGGGWKVSTLLGMPAARGLFQRAAVQSGSLLRHVSRDFAAQAARGFITHLNLTPKKLGRLRELPWSDLLAAQDAVGAPAFAPVCDGVHIDVDPIDPVALARCDEVPLIVSTTLDDAGLFFPQFSLTDEQLRSTLDSRYGAEAARLHATYRALHPSKSPYLTYAQLITDSGFRRFAHAQAEAKAARATAPVYMYLWEWPSPADGGKFGATHGMDVSASLYNARDALLGGSESARTLCDVLAGAWLAFARCGDPNHARSPLWPRFEPADRATLVLDRDVRIERDPHRALRELWCGMPPAASVLG